MNAGAFDNEQRAWRPFLTEFIPFTVQDRIEMILRNQGLFDASCTVCGVLFRAHDARACLALRKTQGLA